MQARLDEPKLGMRRVDHDVVVEPGDDAWRDEDKAPFLLEPSLAELPARRLSHPGRLGGEKTS